MQFQIKVKPGSKADELKVLEDGTISVKIKAPPVDGKANKYLVKFLAAFFGVAITRVELLKGHNTVYKKINIVADEDKIRRALKNCG